MPDVCHSGVLFVFILLNSPCFLKFLFHSRVVVCKLLYCQSVCLVVGKAEVALRAYEGLFYLLQVSYRLVYLVDCRLELLARKAVVVGKLLLEVVETALKVGYVYRLAARNGQLALILYALFDVCTSSVISGMKNCGRMTYIFG